MKRTISLISLLLVCLCAHAQDCFSVQDGHVIWQEVYETDLDSTSIVASLQASGKLTDIINTPGGLSCTIAPHMPDYLGAGFSSMQVAMLLTRSDMMSHALIQFREGRYRVTVSDISFHVTGIVTVPEFTTLIEDYLDRKGNFKNTFRSNHVDEVLDYDFNRIFELKDIEEEEW